MNKPRILVGCPTADIKGYCLQEYAKGIQAVAWQNKEILLVDNSSSLAYAEKLKSLGIPVIRDTEAIENVKERIAHSRNVLREKVLKEGYDYFLSLEQDVIPPHNVIERLLQHKKPVVSGVYFTVYYLNDELKMRPLVWKDDPAAPDKMQFMNAEVREARGKTSSLHRIKAAGLGCVLIHRSVLEKIRFRTLPETYDDIPFYKDCAANSITPFADLALMCKHVVNHEGQVLVLPPE